MVNGMNPRFKVLPSDQKRKNPLCAQSFDDRERSARGILRPQLVVCRLCGIRWIWYLGSMETPAPLNSNEPIPSDYRIFLSQELSRRIRSNSGYSLRAFARDLDVDPSYLSKVLRRVKPLTLSFLQATSVRLELSPEVAGHFVACLGLVASDTAKGEVAHYMQLSQDTFEIIANWQNYAVLEMMKLSDFEADLGWIANRLAISKQEVGECVDRLQRAGLLQIADDQTWTDLSDGFSTHVLGPNYSTVAHRKAQREILRLATAALEEVPIEERDQSSVMMATSRSKLNTAKDMIRDFRRKLTAFLEEGESKDTVFQLSLSLFPITTDMTRTTDKTERIES